MCSLNTIPAGFRASHPEEEFIKFAHQWTIKKDGYSFPKNMLSLSTRAFSIWDFAFLLQSREGAIFNDFNAI